VPAKLRDPQWVLEVRGRFPNPAHGWFQLPMKRVVREIEPCWGDENGRHQFRLYMGIVHLFGDRHSHVSSYDTGQYLAAEDEGALTIQLGPTKRWVPQALVVAAWLYGQIFDLAAEHFEIADLEDWRKRWQRLMARCRPIDREAVRDVGRNDPCPCGSGLKFKQCHLELVN
jgi:hypothetical protein